jgi:tyrosinase
MGSCEKVAEAIKTRPVRYCIDGSPESNKMVDLYRQAVASMKALPSSDPRNWTNQALIHQNHCPHGNFFFFPWHRAYIYYFELICRELCGDDTFALPFWDWSTTPRIPGAFWGNGNPLYNATRTATPASVADPNSVGLPLVDRFCNEPNFTIFAGSTAPTLRARTRGGTIENTPHNYIHGFVGGDMMTFMSPLDPVFWPHHCMVDVCWFEWNILRNHNNTNDPFWLNFDYSGMFVDGQGNPVSMTTQQTLLLPLVSYKYNAGIDCMPLGDNKLATSDDNDLEKLKAAVQKGAPVVMNVKQRFVMNEAVAAAAQGTSSMNISTGQFEKAINNDKSERVIMELNNVLEPVETNAFLRVFINNTDANAETSTEDVSYAGSFAFFRHSIEAPAEKVNFTVDITDTLRKLKKNDKMSADGNITVTFVAIPFNENENTVANITVGSIQINIADVTVNEMKF